MMTTENENPEAVDVEVFTEEQLTILPKEAKDSIVFLSSNLPAKELKVLNPLVVKLIEIKKHEGLVYNKEDKESIEKYKKAVKDITAFKTSVKDAKSSMKKPIDAIGKEILNIEKSINKIADDVKGTIEKTFDEYLKEVKAKAEAAAEKKRQKDLKVIEELSEEQQKTKSQIEKNSLINKIKYELAEPWDKKVNEAVETYSEAALKNLLVELNSLTILTALYSITTQAQPMIDNNVLPQEDFDLALTFYKNKITALHKSVSTRIELLNSQETNKMLVNTVESKQEAIKSFGGFAVNSNETHAPITDSEKTNKELTIGDSTSGETTTNNDVDDLISEIKIELEAIKKKYTEGYNEAKKLPGAELKTQQFHKLSGACILLGKTIDYINQ